MRVLIDSSVWIDFFRAADQPSTRALEGLVSAGEDLCICGHILSEVLRGTRHDEQYRKIERRFSVLQYLPMTQDTFRASADIFRYLRRQGLTLKNPMDTYIAAVALEQDVWFLYDDRDFDLIGGEYPLKAFPKP